MDSWRSGQIYGYEYSSIRKPGTSASRPSGEWPSTDGIRINVHPPDLGIILIRITPTYALT
ncbi:hypothetical protein M7I_7948 [Glarea lozoyensis 74030]|uniref:Uncharacterized protein n=1 Tax=Glarea lozoyensis (strain ATCC 74030 / MF5533) TaxID=1104152 RepID=H0EYP1_GLAL7|nr:hypothetical protein M7I_7948 [Glarea lozoyensis 74030]